MTRKGESAKTRANHQKIKLTFFIIASAATFYLAWQVFSPFLMLTATAVVAAIVLAPFHHWLSEVTGHHYRICAFLATLISVVAVGLPLGIGIMLLVQEIGDLRSVDQRFLEHPIWNFVPRELIDALTTLDVNAVLGRIVSFLSANIADILASTSQVIIMTLLFFVILYYLLAEREEVYHKILAMSPLSDRIDNSLIKRLTRTIRAVVLGSVVVGCVQGVLAGIGFLIFGVPNALIWGVLTLIAAQIPMAGTAIITVPAAVYLAITGNMVGAIGLGVWGAVLVGGIDNFLKPKLVEGKTNMHPLLILLSMFGGLQFFGPVGFILGPAVLAAALAFLEMYETGVLAGAFKL